MNILVVTERIPYPIWSGSTIRIHPPFRILGKRHKIILFCFIGSKEHLKYLPQVQKIFHSVRHMNDRKKGKRELKGRILNILSLKPEPITERQYPNYFKAVSDTIREIISEEKIDIVYTHLFDMAQYTNGIRNVSKVLDLVDSETLFLWREITKKRMSFSLSYIRELFDLVRARKWEKMIPRFHDVTVLISPKDADIIHGLSPKSTIKVIPNGVDVDYYFPSTVNAKDRSNILTFHGHMSYPPNVDAMLYFFKHIMPLVVKQVPDLKLLIVGKNPSPEIKKLQDSYHVQVTGFVEDIRPFLWQASICIFPLRKGGGFRNKIAEAMAVGKPVITTTMGAEGLEVVPGKHCVIADRPKEFAGSIIELLKDQQLMDNLGDSARKFMVKHYSWENVAAQFESLYKALIEQGKPK